MKKLENIHYGWIIVVAAFLIMGIAWSITFNLQSLFITSYARELDLSRSAVNFSFTIRSICQLVISIFCSRIYRRFDLHRTMKIASITFLISMVLFTSINSLAGLYICTTIMSLSNFLISVIPLSIILNNWFNENLGKVTGIAFMGSGIITAFLSPIVGYIISFLNWRYAYIFLAIIVGIFLIPSVFLLIREKPSSMGLKPYGKDIEEEVSNEGLSLARVKEDRSFWLLLLALFLLNISFGGLMPNISPHLENLGYSIEFSSTIVSITALVLAFGKMFLGSTYDSRGIRFGSVSASIATALGLFSLAFINLSDLLFISLIIFTGYGMSFGTVGSQNIVRNLYGNKDYSSIFSYFQAAMSIGSLISPIIIGVLFDIYKTYFHSILLCLAVCVASIFIFILLPSKENEPFC